MLWSFFFTIFDIEKFTILAMGWKPEKWGGAVKLNFDPTTNTADPAWHDPAKLNKINIMFVLMMTMTMMMVMMMMMAMMMTMMAMTRLQSSWRSARHVLVCTNSQRSSGWMEFLGTGFFFLQMYFSGNEACKSWASLIFQGNKLFLDKIARLKVTTTLGQKG